jgi:hypothetical protein
LEARRLLEGPHRVKALIGCDQVLELGIMEREFRQIATRFVHRFYADAKEAAEYVAAEDASELEMEIDV